MGASRRRGADARVRAGIGNGLTGTRDAGVTRARAGTTIAETLTASPPSGATRRTDENVGSIAVRYRDRCIVAVIGQAGHHVIRVARVAIAINTGTTKSGGILSMAAGVVRIVTTTGNAQDALRIRVR